VRENADGVFAVITLVNYEGMMLAKVQITVSSDVTAV
jgi:hypothetical protein